MPHRSRFRGFIIACQDADPEAAGAFWSAALGARRRRKPQGKYVKLGSQSGLHVEVQKVPHPSRVHLDIAADDVPPEVARLERLGARVVERIRTWTVMEEPTGHRFCIVGPQGADRPGDAKEWR